MLSLDEFAHNFSTTQHEYQTEPFSPLQTLDATNERLIQSELNHSIQLVIFCNERIFAFSQKYSRLDPTKNKHTEHKKVLFILPCFHIFHLNCKALVLF